MDRDTTPLPPIDEWWPFLTIGARRAVIDAPSAPLAGRVRQEIEMATGVNLEIGARLSSEDIDFLEMQRLQFG